MEMIEAAVNALNRSSVVPDDAELLMMWSIIVIEDSMGVVADDDMLGFYIASMSDYERQQALQYMKSAQARGDL